MLTYGLDDHGPLGHGLLVALDLEDLDGEDQAVAAADLGRAAAVAVGLAREG